MLWEHKTADSSSAIPTKIIKREGAMVKVETFDTSTQLVKFMNANKLRLKDVVILYNTQYILFYE